MRRQPLSQYLRRWRSPSGIAVGTALLWGAAASAWFARLHAATTASGFGVDLDLTLLAVSAVFEGRAPYALELAPYTPSYLAANVPLALLPVGTAHLLYLAAAAVTIPAAAALTLTARGVPWQGKHGALVLLGLAVFQPVRDAVGFLNVNVIIVLLLAGWISAETKHRYAAAAVLLGVSFAMKPVLIGLLLLPLLRRQWTYLATAITLPLATSALVLPFLARPGLLVTKAAPALLGGWGPELGLFNASLHGVALAHGVPAGVELVARLLVAACVVLLVHKTLADPLVAHAAALLGSFLVASFALNEYAVLLVPAAVILWRDRVFVLGLLLVGLPIDAPVGEVGPGMPAGELRSLMVCCGFLLCLAGLARISARSWHLPFRPVPPLFAQALTRGRRQRPVPASEPA